MLMVFVFNSSQIIFQLIILRLASIMCYYLEILWSSLIFSVADTLLMRSSSELFILPTIIFQFYLFDFCLKIFFSFSSHILLSFIGWPFFEFLEHLQNFLSKVYDNCMILAGSSKLSYYFTWHGLFPCFFHSLIIAVW